MSRPYARGAVVSRGGRFALVWQDHGPAGLDILPLRRQEPERRANDVLLDWAELLACQVSMIDAMIRPVLVRTTAAGQETSGTAPDALLNRIAEARRRATEDAVFIARWSGARQ